MKGELIYKILDFLEDRVVNSIDFVDVFIKTGYGASFGKFEKEFQKKSLKNLNNQIKKDQRRRLKKYISKLKKEDLLSENPLSKCITLTSKGKRKLNSFKSSFSLNKKYEKENSDKVVIISYDIPVPFNKERNVLRDILRTLGFNMVHKSVWIGKVKIPREFIIDLQRLGILDYIEILEVTKSGSLKPKN